MSAHNLAQSTQQPESRLSIWRLGAGVRDYLLGLPLWSLYHIRRTRTVVVLGMHRSGTSSLARMINLCGASLGGPVAGANDWNQSGHWESVEGLAINDLILTLSGGSWDNPPGQLYCDRLLRWKMRRFMGQLHRDGTAIWKDPRTVLTFPLWKPFLKNYTVAAIFRHPMSVARSLQRRDGFSLEKGLDLWCHYNEHLLAICEKEEKVHWFDFDRGPDHFVSVLHGLAQQAGLSVNQQALDSYAPELRTSDAHEEPKSARVRNVYAKLRLCLNTGSTESARKAGLGAEHRVTCQ